MSLLRAFSRSRSGTTLAEFALILPIFLILVFGAIELGNLMWQVQQGGIASKQAVRIASTRALISPGAVPDCGVPTSLPAGTFCTEVPGSSSWSITCNGATGGAGCGPDLARVVDEIQRFYPQAADENIEIELSGAGLGFVGLGKPVPIITVRFVNLQYDFIFLNGLAGLNTITLPALSASAPAEDIVNGPGA